MIKTRPAAPPAAAATTTMGIEPPPEPEALPRMGAQARSEVAVGGAISY